MTMQLRDYQRESVDAIYRHFEARGDNPLIVIPTGGGKAPTLATFMREVIEQWPDQRILSLVHVRELVQQNLKTLYRIWPEAPASVYSAGLGRKDLTGQIVLASIQSIYQRGRDMKPVDLVIVDEAHLIPHKDEGMYRRLFADLAAANSYWKIIGYTATPFRMTSGRLDEGEGALFGSVAYEIGIGDLIVRGWLCRPVPKPMETKLDVSGVRELGGDFVASELAAAVDVEAIRRAAVDEIVAYGQNRRSWLAFGSSVEHAYHIRDAIHARGFTAETITGDTPAKERATLVDAYKAGEIRCLTNCDVLTVGFDAPATDLLAVLRPTKSRGLWIQICGRGTRLSPETGKTNCLVLDFGGNAERFGPIDQAVESKKPVNGTGVAPVKTCANCQTTCYAGVQICPKCGTEFPPPVTAIEATAGSAAILSAHLAAGWVDVDDVIYARHDKPGNPPSLRVKHVCGPLTHEQWVTLEHSGYPRDMACRWWRERSTSDTPPPSTIDEALARQKELRKPKQIAIRRGQLFIEIDAVRFE
jgi:DNA repair protein RadD